MKDVLSRLLSATMSSPIRAQYVAEFPGSPQTCCLKKAADAQAAARGRRSFGVLVADFTQEDRSSGRSARERADALFRHEPGTRR